MNYKYMKYNYFKSIHQKTNLVVFKNSLKIPKFLKKKRIILRRGLYIRYVNIDYFMIGLTFGRYVSNKRLYNFVVFRNKKRR